MAAGVNVSGFLIPRLNADNYSYWSQKVQMLLRRDGLWSCVDNPPEDMDEEQNDKALATIVLTLEDQQLVHVRGITSAAECWATLRRIHVRDSVGSQIHLTRKLFRARLQEGGNMLEHIANIKQMLMDLNEKEVFFTDNQEAFILLSSLDASYDVFISTLEVLPKAELTMTSVTSRLLEESQRRADSTLLRKSSPACSKQPEEEGSPEGGGSEKAFAARRCYSCGSTKHLVRECKVKKKKNVPRQSRNFVHLAKMDSIQRSSCEWLLDSGSSAHICYVRNMFTQLNYVKDKHVTLANGMSASIKGQGTVYLSCLKKELIMNYVPNMRHNLLSVSRLAQEGFELTFRREGCELKGLSGLCLNVQEHMGLYVIKDKEEKAMANMYGNIEPHKDCIHVWHRRLGHACYKTIKKTLGCAQAVKTKQCDKYVRCDPCLETKSKCAPIGKTSDVQVNQKLQLVALDLIGPMPHVSFGGARYILSIQDQFSRFGFCYLLKDKAQTAKEFESWLLFVERKTGLPVKIVQSDNGSEFTCEKFQEILKRHGIAHRRSAPYTPTQNAFIERRGQTLQNMSNAMLCDSKLSPKFWGESVLYANLLLNILFHHGISDSPYHKWTGRKPSLNHLHAFGAKSWVVTPSILRRKGDAKAKKMFFLGCQSNRKAFRFGTHDGKIFVSSNATIDDAEGLEKGESVFLPSQPHASSKQRQGLPSNQVSPKRGSKESSECLTPNQPKGESPEERALPNSSATPTPYLRRSKREIKPPDRFSPSVYYVTESEPSSYDDVMKLPKHEKQKWLEAIQKEIDSLRDLQVFEQVQVPTNNKILGCRWIFKRKVDANGDKRYRARLVAKGYLQTAADFDQIFAPVTKPESLRSVLAYAGKNKCILHQIDFETAFLNADLEQKIFLEIPPGVGGDQSGMCWKLKKSLYGLKQSAHMWNSHLSNTLKSQGFVQGTADPCLFRRGRTLLLCYVDDVLIISPSENEIHNIIKSLKKTYKIRDLGRASNFLGVEIEKVDEGFKISQKKKIEQLIEQYNMKECKGVKTPMIMGFDSDDTKSEPYNADVYSSLIGSLLYLSQWSRPEIAMSVNYLAKFCKSPTHKHWLAAKWVVRYLKQNIDHALYIVPEDELKLTAYADANFGNDVETRQSTTGIAIFLGNSLVHWKSVRQHFVSLSTAESEYCSLSYLCKELIWFKQLIMDIGLKCDAPIVVYDDNQAVIHMATSPGVKARSKHTDIRYKNVKQCVQEGLIKLQYCNTENNVADCMTKVQGPSKHDKALTMLGVR